MSIRITILQLYQKEFLEFKKNDILTLQCSSSKEEKRSAYITHYRSHSHFSLNIDRSHQPDWLPSSTFISHALTLTLYFYRRESRCEGHAERENSRLWIVQKWDLNIKTACKNLSSKDYNIISTVNDKRMTWECVVVYQPLPNICLLACLQ